MIKRKKSNKQEINGNILNLVKDVHENVATGTLQLPLGRSNSLVRVPHSASSATKYDKPTWLRLRNLIS